MANPLSMRALAQALIQDRGVMPGTRHAPGSDEEDIAYGYPGQGDAYDNPQNPNYYLNDLQQGPTRPGGYAPMGRGMSEDVEELGMQELANQGPTRPGAYGPMGAGMSEDAEELGMQELADQEDWTDTGMQKRFGVDPYGNPIPGTPQFPFKSGRR